MLTASPSRQASLHKSIITSLARDIWSQGYVGGGWSPCVTKETGKEKTGQTTISTKLVTFFPGRPSVNSNAVSFPHVCVP